VVNKPEKGQTFANPQKKISAKAERLGGRASIEWGRKIWGGVLQHRLKLVCLGGKAVVQPKKKGMGGKCLVKLGGVEVCVGGVGESKCYWNTSRGSVWRSTTLEGVFGLGLPLASIEGNRCEKSTTWQFCRGVSRGLGPRGEIGHPLGYQTSLVKNSAEFPERELHAVAQRTLFWSGWCLRGNSNS